MAAHVPVHAHVPRVARLTLRLYRRRVCLRIRPRIHDTAVAQRSVEVDFNGNSRVLATAVNNRGVLFKEHHDA
jgi:hypothetical protein